MFTIVIFFADLSFSQVNTVAVLPPCMIGNGALEASLAYVKESQPKSELLARLAYAETLAANCPKQVDLIVLPIAATILNRTRIRNGDAVLVIFEKNQFASSLNNYKESRIKDFLCPTDESLWIAASKAVQTPLENFPKDGVNYYLFKHSARFKPPAWAKGPKALPKATFQGSDKIEDCVQFFRNGTWK